MAKGNSSDERQNKKRDKLFKRQLTNINNLIGQANLSLYGTDRTSEIDNLNIKFQSIMNDQMDNFTNRSKEDLTSFLGQIISNDNKTTAAEEILNNQFMSLTGDEYSTMQSFIYDAYRNRLLEQSDLHEVSSQLIELSEAILITRDAIISPDVVEGRMNRSFKFENLDEDDISNTTAIIENMEKRFKLLEKIKNFIIPKTLEYGEFYCYVIPYSKLFESLVRSRDNNGYENRLYRESTIMESFVPNAKKNSSNKEDSLDYFLESTYEKFNIQKTTRAKDNNTDGNNNEVSKEEFKKDLKNIMENITICNDAVPFPIMEEGIDSIAYLKHMYESTFTEAENKKKQDDDMFNRVANAKMTEDGIIFDNDKSSRKKKEDFSDIGDVYIRMIEPTRIIPIEIMNTTLGYYFVQDEDITPLSGAVSSTLYFTKFDEHSQQRTVIDALAERVVKSFDKSFLKNNIKFKEAIVDCFTYYNLNEKRLKFQFIPAEYIQEFKIDEDMNGNGTSMIKKSLFYAKLYLMLLLFKIMSIILHSNDTKVNYIKQSGIDKNVANKVQEIARIRQSRQINMSDLFSYTTLINKVGNGSEMYIPTGRSGERPIETEILSGQDVPLNSELLEMLKNAYILGTGVPAAIVNYLQEADFAKTVEQNNSKFNGRVVNYQLDFNSSITELYKKIMRGSTNISENIIDNFVFMLQPPKTTLINTKSEIIGQFSTLVDFLVSLKFEDPNSSMNAEGLQKEIREFKQLFAKEQLPMIDMEKVEELVREAQRNALKDRLKPDPSNGDSGDDIGLDEELANM